MRHLMMMFAFHYILLGTILLSTTNSAVGQKSAAEDTNDTYITTEALTTLFDLSETSKGILPQDNSTNSVDETKGLSAPAVGKTTTPEAVTTEQPSRASTTTKVETATPKVTTTAKAPTTTRHETKAPTTTRHETKAPTTTRHETSKEPASTTSTSTASQTKGTIKTSKSNEEPKSTTSKSAQLLTIKPKVSSETSSIENSSTKGPSTDSSFLGVDKNSFTAKVILPIAAGIILAVFIVLIVCSIRSCLDKKERKSSRRTMDHDMAPMDRVMLLADSSEDEF